MFKKIKAIFKKRDNTQLAMNILGNYIVKGCAMIVSLLLTPAYMSYFYSNKLLGMWFTVITTLNWLMMFDFGIGGGIRNQLVYPLLKNDKDVIRKILSTGFISIGSIVIVLIILQYFVVKHVNWYVLLGVISEDISPSALYQVVHILIIGILVRFFTVLISHVLYAMQHATIPSFMILLSNIMLLIYIRIVKPSGTENDIINLAIVYSLATNIPTFGVMVILFSTQLQGTFPKIRFLDINMAKNILFTGTGLFYLQVLMTLLFGTKELFITWFVGVEQVVEYNIYLKLIGIVSTLFSLSLTPIWSAVTKAHVKSELTRIKTLYFTGTIIISILSIAQLLLVFFMPWIAKIWLRENNIPVSYQFSLIFCLYNTLNMWIMMNYNFSCGLGMIKIFAIYLSFSILLNLGLAFWWCGISHSWISVILAAIVASLPVAFSAPKTVLRIFNNSETVCRDTKY